MKTFSDAPLCEALVAFFDSTAEAELFGNGHINSTFLANHNGQKYVLQKINTNIFKKPDELMQNILAVTGHIGAKAKAEGKDPARYSLSFIRTHDGEPFFTSSDGGAWRAYIFVDEAIAFEKVNTPTDFYNCAYAFGEFQQKLADFDARTLNETIVDFHHTPKRFNNLMSAVEKNASGRASDVAEEIEFAKARKDFCATLENARELGELPLRVTHNDTKLNNILFDKDSEMPICVIDLDTVMPGYSVNDFGDSIRFGANTAVEDETDLSKVSLDLELFKAYAEGFIKGCNGALTKKELELLPVGAMMMTLECGMRFLADHIDGDVYFKIHRENHNLDRCRCQFALVADMERKLDQMNKIIADIVASN